MEHLIRLKYLEKGIELIPRDEIEYLLIFNSGITTNGYPSIEALLKDWPDQTALIVRRAISVTQVGNT